MNWVIPSHQKTQSAKSLYNNGNCETRHRAKVLLKQGDLTLAAIYTQEFMPDFPMSLHLRRFLRA